MVWAVSPDTLKCEIATLMVLWAVSQDIMKGEIATLMIQTASLDTLKREIACVKVWAVSSDNLDGHLRQSATDLPYGVLLKIDLFVQSYMGQSY